jgi:hypothetical protein
MSSPIVLLPVIDKAGVLLVPPVLQIGKLDFETTVSFGWTIAATFRKILTAPVKFRRSRAINPKNVCHRILIDRVEVYTVRVDMRSRTISFGGPFEFRTPPGASDNLCDYKIVKFNPTENEKKASSKASHPAEEPFSVEQLKVGAFFQIRYSSSLLNLKGSD